MVSRVKKTLSVYSFDPLGSSAAPILSSVCTFLSLPEIPSLIQPSAPLRLKTNVQHMFRKYLVVPILVAAWTLTWFYLSVWLTVSTQLTLVLVLLFSLGYLILSPPPIFLEYELKNSYNLPKSAPWLIKHSHLSKNILPAVHKPVHFLLSPLPPVSSTLLVPCIV